MATHSGEEGIVEVGGNAVAEVRAFSFTETLETYDDSAKGDAYKTHLNGKKEWNGELTCWWSDDDTTGQDTLTVGASVTLTLLVEGDTTGDVSYSGTATITDVAIVSPEAGTTEISFNFLGNGALTKGTVA